MTRTSVKELAEALRPRYAKASRSQKSKILDEFVAVTGFHRKAAICQLRRVRRTSGKQRGRPRVYTPDVVAALRSVWEVCGCICSKRLAPFLPEAIALLPAGGALPVKVPSCRLRPAPGR